MTTTLDEGIGIDIFGKYLLHSSCYLGPRHGATGRLLCALIESENGQLSREDAIRTRGGTPEQFGSLSSALARAGIIRFVWARTSRSGVA